MCTTASLTHAASDRMARVPSVVLWAWEQPQDLRDIDPARVGVASLARTLTLSGDRVSRDRASSRCAWRRGRASSRWDASRATERMRPHGRAAAPSGGDAAGGARAPRRGGGTSRLRCALVSARVLSRAARRSETHVARLDRAVDHRTRLWCAGRSLAHGPSGRTKSCRCCSGWARTTVPVRASFAARADGFASGSVRHEPRHRDG
jgi:hypothetical protein